MQAHGHTHNKRCIGSVVITDYAYLLVWITIIYSCDGGSVHQREQIISEIIVLFLHWHALFISHTAGKQVHNVCMVLLLFTFQTSLNSWNCLYQELNLLYRYWMFATYKVLPFSPGFGGFLFPTPLPRTCENLLVQYQAWQTDFSSKRSQSLR